MPDLIEAIECPWCWEPTTVPVEDGQLKEHPDLVPGRSCRGSGETSKDVAQAEDIDRMCRTMLDRAGYADWVVRWSAGAPSECHTDSKEIWMYDRRVHNDLWYYIKEGFIHEMAHIDTIGPIDRSSPRTASEQGHDPAFFQRYGELLVQLADVEIPPKKRRLEAEAKP